MATTGFGIVGCGMIANFHAEAIKHIKGAKLVACCSSRQEAADKFGAANPGTKVHGKETGVTWISTSCERLSSWDGLPARRLGLAMVFAIVS